MPRRSSDQAQPLAYWRKRALMTQRELAEAIGAKVPTVRAWEQGVNEPRPATHRKLAQVLGLDDPWLIAFKHREPKKDAA